MKSGFVLVLSLAHAMAWAAPDCLSQAADFHNVNETVLRAIAWHESRNKSWLVLRNSNNTYDLGLMGINSVHLDELSRFGIGPKSLLDPCISAFVGAWKYSKKISRHGNNWKAVGAYHSETPHLRDAYIRKIHDIVYAPAPKAPRRENGQIQLKPAGAQP